MHTEKLDIIDISHGHSTIATKRLYRVLLHRKDGTEPIRDLCTAEIALAFTASFNRSRVHAGESWTEVVSYEDWETRDVHERYFEDVNEAVAKRLAKMAEADPEPQAGIVRRLFTRAAALIW